ncbi:hypothetical protein TrCOL_g8315 [Triparma columacea]|uniref:Uncharacterized protein n=1 Tax=Triparma columacea TaxID=722753 RepID=A0A9W7LC47_9STRA|nr:hypothetical protein TrCOL_g8315 [Triparma columacea]
MGLVDFEGSSQPLHPYISTSQQDAYVLTMSVALILTTFTTYTIYTHHFNHFYAPNLQRLSLRISSIPLIYSLLAVFTSIYPPTFWLTSVTIGFYEGYAMYNLLALIVTWAGGVEGAKVECASYMQKLELDVLMSGVGGGGGGGRDDGRGKDELGYLDIDELQEDGREVEEDEWGEGKKEPSFERNVQVSNFRNGFDDENEHHDSPNNENNENENNNNNNNNNNNETLAQFYGSFGTSSNLSLPPPSPPKCYSKFRLTPSLKMLLLRLKFDIFTRILTLSGSCHFHRAKILVSQAMFLKPLLLIFGNYFFTTNDPRHRLVKFLSTAPVIFAILSLLHVYFVLRPLLEGMDVGRKLGLIKGLVVLLAAQQTAVEIMEATGGFQRTFHVQLYSNRRVSVRFYEWLVILEMSLLAPVFGCLFKAGSFKAAGEHSKVVRGLTSPWNLRKHINTEGMSGMGGSCNSMEKLGKSVMGKCEDYEEEDEGEGGGAGGRNNKGGKGRCGDNLKFVCRFWEIFETQEGGEEKVRKYSRLGWEGVQSEGLGTVDGDGIVGLAIDMSKGAGIETQEFFEKDGGGRGIVDSFEYSGSGVIRGNFPGDIGKADSFANDGEVFEV